MECLDSYPEKVYAQIMLDRHRPYRNTLDIWASGSAEESAMAPSSQSFPLGAGGLEKGGLAGASREAGIEDRVVASSDEMRVGLHVRHDWHRSDVMRQERCDEARYGLPSGKAQGETLKA